MTTSENSKNKISRWMTTCSSCKSMTFCKAWTCKAGLQQKLQSLHKHCLKEDKQKYFHCRLTINQNMPTNTQTSVYHLEKNRSKRVVSMLERQTLKTKERLTKLNAKSGQKKGSRSLETGRHSDDAHSCTLLHLKSDILTFAWFATECPDGCSSRMLCQRIANFLFVMH